MTSILPHEIAARLGEIADELTQLSEAELLQLGWDAISIILLRTKAGTDADGNPFAPYSQSYADKKLAKGWTSLPTLTATGQMLGGMMPRISGPNEVAITFASEFDARKAAWNNPTRNFFDVRAESELSLLAESLLDYVAK